MLGARVLAPLLSVMAVKAADFSKLKSTVNGGDDASLHCLDGTAFCQRTREFKID